MKPFKLTAYYQVFTANYYHVPHTYMSLDAKQQQHIRCEIHHHIHMNSNLMDFQVPSESQKTITPANMKTQSGELGLANMVLANMVPANSTWRTRLLANKVWRTWSGAARVRRTRLPPFVCMYVCVYVCMQV